MLFDLREAFRSVLRHARFSAVVCSILALGIGATTLVFSIEAVLFLNSWIQHPERLGWIFSVDTRHANDRAGVSLADFLDFRERTHAFASLGARTATTLTFSGHGQASRLGAWQTTVNLMDICGLPITNGRGFREGEDLPAAPRVVIISNRLWQTGLGGDPSIVGTSITLDGVAHAVIGVLDSRFDTVFPSTDLWVPFDLAAARKGPRDARLLSSVVGVLAGVAVARAHSECMRSRCSSRRSIGHEPRLGRGRRHA